MKKTIFFIAISITSFVVAQEIPQFLIQLGNRITPSPTINSYEEVLEKHKSMSEGVFDLSKWEDIKLVHKKGTNTISFKSMSELDKHLFILMMGERTSIALLKLEQAWTKELEKFDDVSLTLVPGDDPPAIRKDVQNYLIKIKKLRKEFDQFYINYSKEMFVKFNEIPGTDKESYIKKIEERK